MDVAREVLVAERVRICMATQGGVSWASLEAMPWDEYEAVIREVNRAVKEQRNADGPE